MNRLRALARAPVIGKPLSVAAMAVTPKRATAPSTALRFARRLVLMLLIANGSTALATAAVADEAPAATVPARSAQGLAAASSGRSTLAPARVLDDLRDTTAWKVSASDQVRASLRRDPDGSLCLEADFGGVSGYAVMRRELPVDWPAHFELVARAKGSGAVNDIQLKLVDASGENVWWVNRPDHRLPARLTDWPLRQRHIRFAWGPASDKALRRTRFVEWVIAAGRDGGVSRACLSRLTLQARPADPNPWPEPRVWTQGRVRHVDWQQEREFNGLELRWPAGATGLDYRVDTSPDGRRWAALRHVRGSDGGLDALWLPQTRARAVRISLLGAAAARSATPPQPELRLRDEAEWPDRNAAVAALAADAPAGDLPRAFRGQQPYWTLVGVDGGGERSGLLSEDGALELGRGGPSVEPALVLDDGRRITWAQAGIAHRLRDAYLPLPSVQWQHDGLELTIEAGADGPASVPTLLALYTLRNTGTTARRVRLQLALRPWQVNPPQQFLTTPGGVSDLARLAWDGERLQVGQRTALVPVPRPQRVTALGFDGGLSLAALAAAPPLRRLVDPQNLASAAMQWELALAPGEVARVGWTAALGHAVDAGANRSTSTTGQPPATGPGTALIELRLGQAADTWRSRLNRLRLQLPPEAQPLGHALRSLLAQILMSRDGPALRPGTRSYARTWVRDGAMMAAALLQAGEEEAARAFLEGFAPYVFDSGKVPCCVDRRGADPVAENDSHGQFLYAVAELWRHTQDRTVLERHWPTVRRVVAYLEQLRQSERTAANRAPGREHLFGLMPPSISHEGYSDKPAYSNWDNFWALRGYKDAVQMAQALGEDAVARQWAAWRDEFARELTASIEASARHHAIGFVAGAADRGDFDATSTTVALNPAQAELPAAMLAATFDRYWQEADARATGSRPWKDYTPYELRTIGALVRMGQPERAHALLRFFLRHQRPAGWNQWAEVVLPDPREPRFLGDMPHAWVAADGIRSLLDLFAYDREAAASIVIGAGLRPDWLGREPIAVQGLSTPLGRIGWRLSPTPEGWLFEVTERPARARELLLSWPSPLPLPRVQHQGRTLTWSPGRELSIPADASRLRLQHLPEGDGPAPAAPQAPAKTREP